MRLLRAVSFLVLTATLSGCINSSTLIKVKPDGSGTIDNTILLNMAAFQGMLAGAGVDAKGDKPSLITEEQLRKMGESMGTGVRFVSSTPIEQNGWQGAKATFAFDDINQLRVSQDPNIGSVAGAQITRSQSSPVTFKLARQGGSSVLTVAFDEKIGAKPSAGAPPPPPSQQMDPNMMAMVKQMFQGAKVGIDLEVQGKIVKTNADYVTGSRVTLMEVDFANLLQDEAKLRQLQARPGMTLGDIRPLLKDVKGVKINEPVVTIEFR